MEWHTIKIHIFNWTILIFKDQTSKSKRERTNDDEITELSAAKRIKTSPKNEESTKAEIKRTSQNKKRRVIELQLREPLLQVNELVWAKMRGFPHWPGVIENITRRGKYSIHFFGDYTRSEITASNIWNFFEGFSLYSDSSNQKLRKAVDEARTFLLSATKLSNQCIVCQIPKLKMWRNYKRHVRNRTKSNLIFDLRQLREENPKW